MTEITTSTVGGLIVSAVVVILTTILVMLFSRSGSRDSTNNGDGSGDGVAAGGLPISDTSSIKTEAPSSSSSSGSWKYDVFLSFRGEDTRKTFVDHLYHALDQQAIRTYKDDVTLARGDTIGPALLSAIQESRIALVVFSENYADSSWCLDELSYIMKCKEERGQIVMPIFYSVDPSHVKKQKGEFGKAFAKHKRSENNKNRVVSWKKSLFDASNIAGWEPKHVTNGHEAKCIQEIVGSILDKLSSVDSAVEDEDLVGMETRLKQLKSQLRIEARGVRMVGIWGLGGGGKTTLATSIYTELSANFDGCCFLENIREESQQQHGLRSLQQKILEAIFHKKITVQSVELGKKTIKGMLCRRKVLIVLDDVDHLDQLNALAGSPDWFGDGSRIIITTRDEHLLTTHRVGDVSPISLLSCEEAIRLFRRHAYCEDKPLQDYEMLSQQIVSYAAGLPLALIVLGSFLYDKDNDEWIGTLSRLKDHPELDIVEKLKISYDGLKDVEKKLFLDIACFYRRNSKDEAMEMLDACGFHPRIGVKVLIQKALISVSKDDKFDMHDLVQEMAHYIVRGEHPNNPEKHSRVWREEDIKDMCLRNATMENDKIEAICLPYCHVPGGLSNFVMLVSNMKKLRFLRVWIGRNYDEGPSFLSNELRYIDWRGYPASPFPESFQPTKLVVLKMCGSLQKELWKGYKYLPCLKELELCGMGELVRTPDFGGLPCLQKLIIEDCDSLEEIHPSLGNHSSVVSVKYLPCLKELRLSSMEELVRTPDFGGLPCLQKLILSLCGSLEEIHESLGNHSSLVSVVVWHCEKLTRFPRIVGMEKLEILIISYCPALVEFPKIEAKMDKLVELSLNALVEFPNIEVKMDKLVELSLNALVEFPKIEAKMDKLVELYLYGLPKEGLPSSGLSSSVTNLFSLGLRGCGNLKSIEGNFQALRKLNLVECGLKDGEMPTEIGEFFGLQELHLGSNYFTRLDFSLSRLTRLKLLELSGCKKLVELPELPSSLAILKADGCPSLEDVIRDEIHTNCKWLSQVSITRGMIKKNIIGGEGLLKTMLQGNAAESGCVSLEVNGWEIARGFEAGLVKGSRCGLQLPDNWFNFSGFLIYAASDEWVIEEKKITMKHVEKSVGSWMGMGDSQHDDLLYWEDTVDDGSREGYTWVRYIPFSKLRHTLWWDQTSTVIQIEIDSYKIRGCGLKLVPNRGGAERSETTTIHSSSSEISLDDDNRYKCKFEIEYDSKVCSIRFSPYWMM